MTPALGKQGEQVALLCISGGTDVKLSFGTEAGIHSVGRRFVFGSQKQGRKNCMVIAYGKPLRLQVSCSMDVCVEVSATVFM